MKEPWFKFWAADFVTDPDVDRIPPEAEGLLVRMWCICRLNGCIPSDHEEIARLTRRKLSYVSYYVSYCVKFFDLRDGMLFSRRMEREKEKSAKARESVSHRKDRHKDERNTKRSTKRDTKTPTQKARKPESQIKESPLPPNGEVLKGEQHPLLDLSEKVFEIAKAHPKLAHLKIETELKQPVADAILEAIAKDGPDLVLRGTKGYAAQLDNPKFAVRPADFFGEFQYRIHAGNGKPALVSAGDSFLRRNGCL